MWSIVRLGAFVPAEQKPDQWSREEEPGARWRREYNRTLEAGRKREAWGHAKARGGGEAEDKCFTWEPRPPCLSLSGRYVEMARFLAFHGSVHVRGREFAYVKRPLHAESRSPEPFRRLPAIE